VPRRRRVDPQRPHPRRATTVKPVTNAPPIHALLEPIAFLIGTWNGNGVGLWGTDFEFEDAVSFSHDGRPILTYEQRTVGRDGTPSHVEAGFFTCGPEGEIYVTIAEPTGITEVLVGHVIDAEISLLSTGIGRTPTADNITAVARRLSLEDGDTLVTEVDISANDEPLAKHTRSVLKKAIPTAD